MMGHQATRRTLLALVMLGTLAGCGGGGDSGSGDATAPATVAGLAVTVATASQANLSWTASSDNVGVTGYRVYRGTGTRTPTLLKSVTSNTTSDTGLVEATLYCYQVSAYDAAGNESAPSASKCATTPAAVLFSGFDFAIATGSFWEYRWDFYDQSWSQGSSTRTATANGRMWVVLGAPTTIQGVTAYAVDVFGDTQAAGVYSFDNRDFAPRWKFLAVSNAQILGSTDGLTLKTIFDARAGKWSGGGFFATLPATTLTVAATGSPSTSNAYLSGAVVVAGRSSSQSQCEYFPGVGSICGDSSYNSDEDDYFRANVGPVGYYYSHSFSDCGGGFCSGGSEKYNVGLTAASFNGQANPLRQESEPNDSPSTATAMAVGQSTVGNVTQTAVASSGNTPLRVSASYTALVEDWYAFTLNSTQVVKITLGFVGSPSADLDLYLVDAFGTTLLASSNADNLTTKLQREFISKSLGAGTYRIAIDGYETADGAVTYTLQLE